MHLCTLIVHLMFVCVCGWVNVMLCDLHWLVGKRVVLEFYAFVFRSVAENIVLIAKAFRRQFIIPEFQRFCQNIDELYWRAKPHTTGQVWLTSDLWINILVHHCTSMCTENCCLWECLHAHERIGRKDKERDLERDNERERALDSDWDQSKYCVEGYLEGGTVNSCLIASGHL